MIRLFELRTEKGLSQRELAKDLQISQGTYNNWENGKTQPSIEQLIFLANYFSVSVDYIVGNTDEYGYSFIKENKLNQDEERLLKIFRGLNNETQTTFLQFLENVKK